MKKIFLLIVLALFSNSFSQALTSDEIVQKYISALGGLEEIKKMNQLSLYGKAVSGGNTYQLFAYEDAAEKYQYASVTGDNYDVKTYYDLNLGWTIQNGVKQTISPETIKILNPNIEDGTYFYLADMEKNAIKTELLGEAKVNGKDAYKVKFTRNGADKNIQYFDKETFYLVKVETTGFPVIEITYGDYKQVPGTNLTLPYYNEKGGIQGTIEKYEINVPQDRLKLILEK